jgi:hypothetical protein
MSRLRNFFLFGLIIVTHSLLGQEALEHRPSPLNMVTSRYKDTYLKIIYSQPQKRGREIFGELVPWGEVWRTGANEATELTITQDILIHSDTLKAGSYSLFTIPGKDRWQVIFNADLGLWGSYNYNPKKDVMRIDAPAQTTDGVVYEPFTISINPRNDKADISLMWDKTQVSFTIQYLEPKPKS